MRKNSVVTVAISILVMFLLGCVRTTTIVRERLDQAAEGNRGYIYGDIPPEVKDIEASRTRTITQVEIELPPYEEWERYEKEDEETWGNRGILTPPKRKYTK